jgi:ribulose-5-phosphate 4-epimerase/fuculose-1-phosphate aldolase
MQEFYTQLQENTWYLLQKLDCYQKRTKLNAAIHLHSTVS